MFLCIANTARASRALDDLSNQENLLICVSWVKRQFVRDNDPAHMAVTTRLRDSTQGRSKKHPAAKPFGFAKRLS